VANPVAPARAHDLHREARGHADGIAQTQAIDGRAKRMDVAVGRIGQHAVDLQARRSHLSDVRQRDPPLGSKAQRARNLGARAPLRISGPVLGEIEFQGGRPRLVRGQQGGRDGDLAVGDLAQRAAILARDRH
jgi:hypothetical protein